MHDAVNFIARPIDRGRSFFSTWKFTHQIAWRGEFFDGLNAQIVGVIDHGWFLALRVADHFESGRRRVEIRFCM